MALSVLRPGAVVLDLSSEEEDIGPTDDEEGEQEVHDAQVPSPTSPAAQHIKEEQVEPASPVPKRAKHAEQSEEAALTEGLESAIAMADSESKMPEEVVEQAAQMERMFKQELQDNDSGASTRAPSSAASSPTALSSAPTTPLPKMSGNAEDALQQLARDGGDFPLRGGALAKLWRELLASQPTLKDKYKEQVGYDAQRKFRARWAAEMWGEVVQSRRKTEFREEQTFCDADFDPIAVWVGREGGGQEAIDGIQFFLRKVCDFHLITTSLF